MDKGYEPVIGLEVHVQLATASKMFCGCNAAAFGHEPNTLTCPICTGQPGVLPVINQQAVEFAIMAGLALNCRIASFTKWDRKNYHYPDLPKGYQISQYDLPLAVNGWVMVETNAEQKRIGIRRAHLEEDTGKLVHRGDHSLVDLNRAGVPLLEIVTEPDIRSAEEAYDFLTKLRTLLRYLKISTADMEKGAMRCEPNISLRPAGTNEWGTLTEIKNLNSFRSVRAALAYETTRQENVLTTGGRVKRLTMGWDEQRNITFPQRSKETANDYRYFPEPDLPPLVVQPEWLDRLRSQLPELPDVVKARFVVDYGLSDYDAAVLVADQAVARFFQDAMAACPAQEPVDRHAQAKTISNWITGDLFRLMNECGLAVEEMRMTPAELVGLVNLVRRGAISTGTAREVLAEMVKQGDSAEAIVQRRELAQISDQGTLEGIAGQVIENHPGEVAQYLSGKESLLQWLMGQVMRTTQGKANPARVLALLKEKLEAKRSGQP
jgi:aspartyl-tRNA(Asn)/glutamyl-tRNA(Gln) amidotransferase subunit B